MTYPPHSSAPVRRHSTPIPPLPDYGRIRRPARADEHPVIAPDHGYDDRPAPGYAPADRFDAAPPAYRDDYPDHYAAPAPYDDYGRQDAPGYPAYQDDRWDDHYRDGASYQYEDDWDDEDWGPPRTNPLAKWGLGLAFFFSPLGLIFSIIGLVQASRRGERGRGLAVAGVIISLISIVLGVLYGAAVAKKVVHQVLSDVSSATASETQAAAGGSSAPAQPAGSAPATVLDACNALMPGLVGAEQQMSAATTPEQAVQVITGMRTAVQQAAGAPDPAFQQHLQGLDGGLQQIIDAMTTGEIPPDLMQTLQDDSVAVGTDCGLAGWTP